MKEHTKTIDDIVIDIAEDATLSEDRKKELIADIRTAIPKQLEDKWLFRIVVIMLGLVALATLAGGIYSHLTAQEKDFPASLIAIGSAALGAIAGLLTPYSTRK